jgi:hypothetical protein
MLLLIMCCHLQVADGCMTTTVTLVLAQPLGAGAPSLVRSLMGERMFDPWVFPQRRPSAFGPELGTQCLLERLILADGQRPALPELGGSARHSLGTHVECSCLPCARSHVLLFRAQRNRWMPHDGLLTVAGAQRSSVYQSTNSPILSTLAEPLPTQLISVRVPSGIVWR